jgi:hypothetical protein
MLPIYFAARFMVRSQATKQQRRYERSLRGVRTVKALFDHVARCTHNPETGEQRSDQPVTERNHKVCGTRNRATFAKIGEHGTTNKLREYPIEEEKE